MQELVHGVVLDTHGHALAGASVFNEKSGRAVLADAAGKFTLAAEQGDALVFTYIGHRAQRVIVEENKMIRVALEALVEQIEEVVLVNTGYQTISKERSAGSFAKPADEVFADRTGTLNILQRLDGLIPGLTINNAPGSGQTFSIRGLSTLGIDGAGTSRDPLYVVDGIPIDDIASINPNDVADISVLKDATASSIWGARAANGVIVISTKRGKRDEKIKLNYSSFMNVFGKPDLKYIPTMNSRQFIQTAREIFDPLGFPYEAESAYTNLAGQGIPLHQQILYDMDRGVMSETFGNHLLDSLGGMNNRNQIRDLFYRNAYLMNHTLSLSGGGSKYAFYSSMSYNDNKTPLPGEKDQGFKINIRQDMNFNNWLSAYLITDVTRHDRAVKRSQIVDNRFYPYQMFQDEQRNPLSVPYVGYLSEEVRREMEDLSQINLDFVPLLERDYGYTKSNGMSNRFTGGLSVRILEGLRAEGTYGYIRSNNKLESFDEENSYLVRSEIVQFTTLDANGQPVYHLPTQGGRYRTGNTMQENWTVRHHLSYDKGWDEGRHLLTALFGHEAQRQFGTNTQTLVRGYNENLQTYQPIDEYGLRVNGLPGVIMPNSLWQSYLLTQPFQKRETEVRFQSYFANIGYSFLQRYDLNASWRIDKSNLFGMDKSSQNKPTWSVGVKWDASSEAFLQPVSWVNDLALRVTYGITGNAPTPGTASSYDVLSADRSPFIPDGRGLQIATAANPKLVWERTENINVGIDFGILDRRLTGALDYYKRNTDDLLGQYTVNGFTGYNTIVGNFGSMTNQGIELSLMSRNIRKTDFRWNTNFVFAYNKNKITQLNNPTQMTTAAQKVGSRYFTGYSAFSVFAYEFAGLDNLGDPQVRLQDGTVTKNRNVAEMGDIRYAGTYQPIWSGGLTNSFYYKDFGLSANIVYNLGHVMRRDVDYSYYYMGGSQFTSGNFNPRFLNRWRTAGDELHTNIPGYVVGGMQAIEQREMDYYDRGDINVLKASFIKFRDITLTYNLPQVIRERLRVEAASFKLQVSNIMLWRANSDGIDPEFHDAFTGMRVPSSLFTSSNYFFRPGNISLGLNVSF